MQVRQDLDFGSFVIPVALLVGAMVVILGVNTRAQWLTAQKSDEHKRVIV